jgi:hypothetical protein
LIRAAASTQTLGLFVMQRLLLILAILCAALGAAVDRKLYFAAPSKPGQHVPVGDTPLTFKTGECINLYLEARTRSVEDQNHFVSLIIDDYRYDEPNYFTDKRIPNVTFEVTRLENGGYERVPFRVSSQGGGASFEYLDVHVCFEIGGAPEKLAAETKGVYQEVASKSLRPEDAAPRIEAIRRQFAPNQPGRYRIRAFYRPNVPGKWKGQLVASPARILITDDR